MPCVFQARGEIFPPSFCRSLEENDSARPRDEVGREDS